MRRKWGNYLVSKLLKTNKKIMYIFVYMNTNQQKGTINRNEKAHKPQLMEK